MNEFQTCETCRYGKRVDVGVLECHGGIPQIVVGPNGAAASLRPRVRSSDLACSFYKFMIMALAEQVAAGNG